jgi:hypothetical protein
LMLFVSEVVKFVRLAFLRLDETPRSQDSVTRVPVRKLHTTGLSMKKLRRTYTRESVLLSGNNS